MTLLVGRNAADDENITVETNEMVGNCVAAVAVATGTATTAYIRCAPSTASNIKVLVFAADGQTKLATSSPITPPGSVGWVSAAISVSITQGVSYRLCAIGDGYWVSCDDGTAWNIQSITGGTYAAPPATYTPDGEGDGDYAGGNPTIYLDGTTGAGTVIPVVMHHLSLLRG